MIPVQRHGAGIRVLVALTAAALMTLAAVVLSGTRVPAAAVGPDPTFLAADDHPAISATVGNTPIGQAMAPGFVGVSFEYKAIHQYTGRNPDAVNPALVGLLRGLAPGQSPVLRIGGDSTDWTWWPVRGVVKPTGVSYNLTKGWLRTTRALAAALGAKLILGVNLATARPALASAEAQALLQGIGRQYIGALEIGNEPDLYGVFAWYRDRQGHVAFSRPHNYSLSAFTKDFSHWSAALPSLPLVGPSFAQLTWMSGLSRFLSAEHRIGTVTVHRYPLHGTTTDPTSPTYPSIPNLLSDTASSGLAQQVAPYVATAHSRHLKFRVDEMNSVSNSGRPGISDTFASSLWILDTLFNLAYVGVDGVNLHTLPNAAYQLFSFTNTDGSWQATVNPVYYGAYAFAQAFPPGARLLPVNVAPGAVKVWATQGADGHTRVVLINKDPSTPVTVQLQLPSDVGPAQLQRLTAPSIDATTGVTFDGQTFGSSRDVRQASKPRSEPVTPALGSYSIELPAASAALLTQ
jgi:hypothetical protein